MSNILDKIREQQKKPEIKKEEYNNNYNNSKCGYRWLTMLIKYDINGNGEVVRCFTKEAKESYIKDKVWPKKNKKKEETLDFDIETTPVDSRKKVSLWEN